MFIMKESLTVMVNNATAINRTNTHPVPQDDLFV